MCVYECVGVFVSGANMLNVYTWNEQVSIMKSISSYFMNIQYLGIKMFLTSVVHLLGKCGNRTKESAMKHFSLFWHTMLQVEQRVNILHLIQLLLHNEGVFGRKRCLFSAIYSSFWDKILFIQSKQNSAKNK